MLILLFGLLITCIMLIVANIYTSAGFVNTGPYFERQFTDDYLTLIGATSCTTILPIIRRMGSDRDYRRWIAESESYLRERFNQVLMRDLVNSMKCVDRDGDVIEMG